MQTVETQKLCFILQQQKQLCIVQRLFKCLDLLQLVTESMIVN